ncbi:secA translation cis-regulator SecM [Lonsdalea quercina]|uniref:secA translation cis-regulator SecM n=1 Tax=Lonsdalea quercina TaxID=71657 RepID=UPI000478F82B|nr:secA translation cis-regulator SecM [Lonsdalea quercina]
MIGILNRWRQFGRRYFWPHLLLGMVAAGFGLPVSLCESQNAPSLSTSAISRHNVSAFSLTDLVALKDAHRRSSVGIDYWHQHAIRTVIRHLSFALTAPQPSTVAEAVVASPAQHQILIETLHALLTQENRAPALDVTTYFSAVSTLFHHSGIWLAQTLGIRAGPLS